MGGALSRRIDAQPRGRGDRLRDGRRGPGPAPGPPRDVAWRPPRVDDQHGLLALIHYIFYGVFAFLIAVAFRDALVREPRR